VAAVTDLLFSLDARIVLWLNQAVGIFGPLDAAMYVLGSDYFVPVSQALGLLGLWFSGETQRHREHRQRAVLRAALSLGFAALVIVICNHFWFRERPFAHLEVANLLYEPTDSSFPANPAAISFAIASGAFTGNRKAGLAMFLLAALWVLARVANGVYYPSDVLAGAAIGMAVGPAARLVLRLMEPAPTWLIQGFRFFHLA